MITNALLTNDSEAVEGHPYAADIMGATFVFASAESRTEWLNTTSETDVENILSENE